MVKDLSQFAGCFLNYFKKKLFGALWSFESSKSKLATQLYQKRGKYTRPFIHSGMVVLMIAAVTLGPILISETNPSLQQDFWQEAQASASVFSAVSQTASTYTFISEKPRAEAIEYEVRAGDTVSNIAQRYDISVDTIVWENNLVSAQAKIKPGQILRVLPVTGVAHQVKRGETVYSIAKRYDISAQAVVDWPYNTFTNDETFALAVGQMLIVPDGVMPKKQPAAPRYVAQVVPPAGTAAGTGQFVWPVGGRITQWYRAWHRGIDIANKSLPGIAAADTGTVIVTGWPQPWAYGNRVMIDHHNGYVTLYAHLSEVYVSPGQEVTRGQVIGQMGSTGRSTGPHLHFEIRQNGAAIDPMGFLK
ncbi:MAG: M23 family metallopeptidase [Candidatus Pacebacteria bacterium]|nr:M23 family metallopeptidase [Candidatus Paceibacterota bacterium]